MKILLINNFHFRRGGADVVYLNTLKLLKSKGHDVECFSSFNSKNIYSDQNIYFIDEVKFFNISFFKKIKRIFRFFYSFKSRKNLRELLGKKNFDVAHVHTYKGILTSSILRELKRNNIPVVFTAHDYGLVDPHNALLNGKFEISENTINFSSFYTVIDKANRNSYLYSFLSFLEYEFNNFIFPFDKNFNKIICVSKFSFNKHLQSKRFKFKLTHLYNFFPDLDKFQINFKKGNYFLFFGRLSKEKGFSTLIEAWDKSKTTDQLWVVGSNEASINNQNLDLKNINNVKFLGFKKGQELFSIISNSSFIIVPSEWYENNPMTIIESYSLGKPVIGSKIGGIPELIEDNKTGFTFEMKNVNELSKIIRKAAKMDFNSYKKMSQNCRNFSKNNFAPEKHYEKLIEIYSNL